MDGVVLDIGFGATTVYIEPLRRIDLQTGRVAHQLAKMSADEARKALLHMVKPALVDVDPTNVKVGVWAQT